MVDIMPMADRTDGEHRFGFSLGGSSREETRADPRICIDAAGFDRPSIASSTPTCLLSFESPSTADYFKGPRRYAGRLWFVDSSPNLLPGCRWVVSTQSPSSRPIYRRCVSSICVAAGLSFPQPVV
jgi:hypothetical protein